MSSQEPANPPKQRPGFLLSLGRSQVAASAATIVDFSTLFLLVEAYRVWYVAATAAGAFLGAVVNFLLNRYWSFGAREGAWAKQAGKYFLVSGTSMLINAGGVWFLTENWGIPYAVSKIIISLAVALFFNFPMHRGFVFR